MKISPRRIAALVTSAAVLALPLAATTVPADAATHYKNCSAMHKKYHHGVGKKGAKDKTSGKKVTNFKVSNSLYKANKKLDRDHDGIACEKR
jgi:uncharacterized membrane protein